MKKTLTIVALIALLAVPFMAVSADGDENGKPELCHQTPKGWRVIPPDDDAYDAHAKHGDFVIDDDHSCPPPPPPPPAPCAEGDPRYQGTEVVEGPWSAWELNADNLLERTRTVTTTIVEYSKQNDQECFRGIPKVVVETETKDPPIELFNNCNRWVVKQGNVELDKGKWSLPFELETAQSSFWEGVISEPKRCLQIPEEPTPTPEPEPTATPVPGDCNTEGDGICPGDDDDPEEHPATGADPNAALAVVTALSGLALAGIGGSILFMKRRASR